MAQSEPDWSKAKIVVAISLLCALATCPGTLLLVPEVREFLHLGRVAQQPLPTQQPQSLGLRKEGPPGHTTSEVCADFSAPTIEASNIRIASGAQFGYNAAFGGSWRITAPGGGFTGILTLATGGQYNLLVTHLTSLETSCPGNGYSPISIQVNSETVATNYDPAENHAANHGMVTDGWLITAHAGQNTLQWTAGALCTHYWIRRIELQPGIN